MRGGYIHNRVLLNPIAKRALRLPNAQIKYEAAIRVGERVLYGDLLIRYGSKLILVEAETSSKRIMNDLIKVEALQAELWIVAQNSKVSNSIKRKLLQHSISPGKSGLFILLLPQALQRLEALIELNSGSNTNPENK